MMHPPKVIQGRVDAFGHVILVVGVVREAMLHDAKHITGAWEGQGHGAKFSKDFVPFFH